MGPYQATGSPIGLPETSRKTQRPVFRGYGCGIAIMEGDQGFSFT